MTRPDYCPVAQEPCQSLCDVRCKIRDTTPQRRKPMTVEQMKQNFETWHKETYVQSLEIYGDTYKNMHVRNRWQGWLAAHGIKE